jgi:hypothetical protein
VRDLLALDVEIAELLPADEASYGFDNIAGVLKRRCLCENPRSILDRAGVDEMGPCGWRVESRNALEGRRPSRVTDNSGATGNPFRASASPAWRRAKQVSEAL